MGDKATAATVTATGAIIGIALAGANGAWIAAAIGAMAIAAAGAIAMPTAMRPAIWRYTLWTIAGTAGGGSGAILAVSGIPIAGATLALTFAIAGGIVADHIRKTTRNAEQQQGTT